MKKFLPVIALAFLTLPTIVFAGGGGGIEYLFNVGPDLLPVNRALASLPSGSVTGFSGFGYGITSSGWKIGGFGLFFYTNGISLQVPGLENPVTGAIGGFGGVISGGQSRLGPFRLSVNLRLGAGGMGITNLASYPRIPASYGLFSLYGSIDGELGVLFVPAMMLSVYAGVGSAVPIDFAVGPVAVPAIIAGVRVTWGSF